MRGGFTAITAENDKEEVTGKIFLETCHFFFYIRKLFYLA
jgi:hypothetical protein